MEGAPLELVKGHIHQAWDNAFTSLLVVWPTPRAGYWHVWMRGPQSAATEEPLPGDLVPELLEEWGFAAERWRHWEVDPQPTNPGLRRQPRIPQPPRPAAGHDRLAH